MLEKLGERRIEKLIREGAERLAQKALSPELEPENEDLPLTPGFPLQDFIEEQYVQDRAEIQNAKMREVISVVRDQAVAREAKRRAGYACESCGERLADSTMAGRFVQAHHVSPLAELGPDVKENVAVLCPNCRARVHAREIQIERGDGGIRFVRNAGGATDSRASPAASPDEIARRVATLFESLPAETQARLLKALQEKLDARHHGRED